MTFPPSPPPAPAIVEQFAAGRPVRAVWVNEEGGVTFRLGSGGSAPDFVKVATAPGADFTAEAGRLRWAVRYVTVPRVLGFGVDAGVAWLHTRGLAGLSAVHPRRLAVPEVAVRAIGAGLRALHDGLPMRTCPFEWSAPGRLAALSPAARLRVGEPPPIDRLVVCHGDACAPNTLIDDDGRCCGHVDLGELGVADRWADLAVATLSLGWNYPGRNWEPEFFGAYGVEPDPARIGYYRRLWQASDPTSEGGSR
ncbi:aminoglycoside phosphotransferase [Mycobacterium triplex]|uniref:Phosphotransferase n=1 Tax=Mycobacterium triplex TaxID=47839 RepID=A0A024JRV2_9MYCO|nr:aminoglycoside phosphotransferase APH(3') [Mycobacterium triplex]ORX04559.1 aminoglycoside phosphotransferase [Mycobacterium triplex]CDO85968.1 phosphotransferase [Mycobacterium triplex]